MRQLLDKEIRGPFPSFIPKTRQEQIQNLAFYLKSAESDESGSAQWAELTWELTEKLNGTSMTVYINGEDAGVCSHGLNLQDVESNIFWRAAHSEQLISILMDTTRNLALQGELIGEGIQDDPYRVQAGQNFFVFDIFDITKFRYLTPVERRDFCEQFELAHVPVLATKAMLPIDVAAVLSEAEGKSELYGGIEREGVVYKCNERHLSFKAVSNRFILRNN